VTTLNDSLSNRPLEILSMIHRVFSSFSSFSGCLEMCPEFSIPLLEFIACPTRHPTCLIFTSLEVMPRVSSALHFDITMQLTIDNDNYKFFTCSYSIL